MRILGGLGRAAAVVALTGSLAAGCGGDQESDKDAAATTTKADYAAMHDAVADVGDSIDESSHGASDYQAVVNDVHAKDPAAVLTDPGIATALEQQQERQDARDQAIEELGDQPAMADPDVKAAYDAFASAAKTMFAFQDSYNADMPRYLRAYDLCTRIFDVKVKTDALSVVPGVFEQDWLDAHMKLAKPCQEQLAALSETENYRMQDYVTSVRNVINKRNQAMEAEGFGRISMDEASRRLKRAATTFIAHLKKITDFSAELEKISAVDEYQSLDALLGQEDGTGSDSASPSPS